MKKSEISVVLSGAAGQGIQTVEHVLTRIAKNSGFHVFATKEYMSRIRGGNNSTEIRISSKPVKAFVDKIDILVPLNDSAIERLRYRITKDTLVLGEEKYVKTEPNNIVVNFGAIAESFGNRIYENSVAIGVLCGIINADEEVLVDEIKSFFSKKSEEVVNQNVNAALKGYEIGKSLNLNYEIERNEKVISQILVNGSEAVAKGAIAGRCNFISSYPMSPATAVFTEIAKRAKEYGILIDQAEDEIAAANMAIAAWYAGARAMVSTSGGGFALMTEAISLSGMIETPIVVHLGQRPGPATGLPTRTEQGDLNLVLYAGHGEFPRMIFAPGDLVEAYCLSVHAFNMADKYQIPVFVLTDQYLLDSFYNVSEFKETKVEDYVVKTSKDYRRYEITEDGISPRGIPGYGEGLVRVDSDEHDEYGHITESFEVRTKMVEKRLRKGETMMKDVLPPKLIGPENYEKLVICWGSNLNIAKEALEILNDDKLAVLHFSQVYPVHESIVDYINKAKDYVFVENNATAQFANLVKLTYGINTSKRILKYDGMPFSVEELVEKIKKVLEVK